MKALGRYAAVGFELVTLIVLGYLGGRLGDGRFGTTYLAWLGAGLGAVIGFRTMFRMAQLEAKRLEKEDREVGPPPGIPSEEGKEEEDEWKKDDLKKDEPN